MWVLRHQRTSGGNFRRVFSAVTTALIVAVFAVAGPLAQPAAAENAIWTGSTLTYEGNTYREVTDDPQGPLDLGVSREFEWVDTSVTPNKSSVLYFNATNGLDPQAQTSASLKTYDKAGASYTNEAGPTPITVERDLTVDAQGQNETFAGTTCDPTATGGIGWIICPISNWLADAVDAVYKLLESFLEVDTLSDDQKGIFQVWDLVRTIANVCFVIAFLAVIYSHLTSFGINNYHIKQMIPRLVLAAIMVNASYIICALAVDTSNMLGHSVQSILVMVRENYSTSAYVDWTLLTGAILGGSGAVAGLGFAAATYGAGTSMAFLVIAALIPAALAVLVAFVILAARQALIMVLVIVSPLAFVAYVLPSTEKLFEKWRKAFVTLLVFFPIFSLLFGASQLVGAIIISSQQPPDGKLHIVLMGLAVQVVPLVITPLLVRFSTGLLGTIAKFANDGKRGLADRGRNWALENAEYHKKNKVTKTARHAANRRGWWDPRARGIGRLGLAMHDRKSTREASNKLNDDYMQHRADRRWNRRLQDPNSAPFGSRRRYNQRRQTYLESHDLHSRAQEYQAGLDGEADRHYKESLNGNYHNTGNPRLDARNRREYSNLRAIRRVAEENRSVAELNENAMKASDTLRAKQLIHNDPRYHGMAVQSGVDNKEIAAYDDSIAQTAESNWVDRQQSNGVLRTMRQQALIAKNRASALDAAMSAADQRTFDTNMAAGVIADGVDYQQIRDAVVQTGVDSRVSKLNTARVESDANLEYQQMFTDGAPTAANMQQLNRETISQDKTAAEIEATMKDRAETNWQRRSRTDTNLQKIRLQRTQAADSLKRAETRFNEVIIEQARRQGDAAPGIHAGNEQLAESLQSLGVENSAYSSAISQIQEDQKSYVMQQLRDDQRLLNIAGGGTRYGSTNVLAQTQSAITKQTLDNISAQKSIYSNEGFSVTDMMDASQRQQLRGEQADEIQQSAAVQYILEEIGNNWAVEKTIDAMDRLHGMEEVLDNEGNPTYYDARAFRQAMINGTALPPPLDAGDVANRRDMGQMVVHGYRNGKNKVSWHANTMQERKNRGLSSIRWQDEKALGREMTLSEAGILNEMRQGKYDAERVASLDPDEIARMVQVMRDPKFRQLLTGEQRKALMNGIVKAQGGETTRGKIKERERGLMNVLANYIDLGDGPDPSDDQLYAMENTYHEVTHRDGDEEYSVRVPMGTPGAREVQALPAGTAPNVYDTGRQDDIGPSGRGRSDLAPTP